MTKINNDPLTAPKKTWGGQWFPQVQFSGATFGFGGQVIAPKAPRFLAANRYVPYKTKNTLKIKQIRK